MATPTDPNFLAGFDSSLFRDAITSTMEMGMPEDEAEKITFYWKPVKTFENPDASDNPYNLSATPVTASQREPVIVPAAIEFESRRADGTPLGQFENPRVKVTLLDVHYEQVKDAQSAVIGGDIYGIDFTAPPIGLGDVTVYQLYLTALDES